MEMDRKNLNLLIFSSYGGGHWRAAEAIRDAFRIRYREVQVVEVINFMDYAHPLLQLGTHDLYLRLLRRFPHVYRYAFQKTHDSSLITFQRWVTMIGFQRLLKLLEETKPFAVVSTHPFPAGAMSTFKWYGLIEVPTITVITDHTDHHYWIHPCTDQYLVGSDYVKQKLLSAGLKEEQVAVTGIPIRPQFSLFHSGDELRRKYGFKPGVPTLLIMGGSWGLIDDGVEVLRLLDQLPYPLQVFFVCGRNQELWEKLTREQTKLKNQVLVTQYIDEVDQLMAASDMIITKPGGVTTTEAIALEVPMLLYKPLPGQEEENAQFLLHAGVAQLAADARDLAEKVQVLLQDPDRLRTMRENESRFPFKRSAFAASDIIYSFRPRMDQS